MGNSFGKRFIITTFGESHGTAIGVVIDGVPAGLKIDMDFIKSELDRRKPGQNQFMTQRKEDDEFKIFSGVFEGYSTGAPIGILIFNKAQKSSDYENIKDLFRPGHADFTYYQKYGIRDYRGGGRSSARESVARVAAGAIAKMMLSEIGISFRSGIFKIGDIEAKKIDFEYAKKSQIYALDKDIEEAQKALIDEVKNNHDSIGGSAIISILGVPPNLGEPLYDKLDSQLAHAMMGINGVKAVEIGDGIEVSKLKGSQNNDEMNRSGFLSNHSGGILGGISNGNEIIIKIHFKPTPSIFKPQKTLNIYGNEVVCELKGRHDPCVAIRGAIVAESMAALVIADMILLNMGSRIDGVKRYYGF